MCVSCSARSVPDPRTLADRCSLSIIVHHAAQQVLNANTRSGVAQTYYTACRSHPRVATTPVPDTIMHAEQSSSHGGGG
jgi:hypothetical protein